MILLRRLLPVGPSRDAALPACVVLVMLIHGLLLLPAWQYSTRIGWSDRDAGAPKGPVAMQVTMRTDPAPTALVAKAAHVIRKAEASSPQDAVHERPPMLSNTDIAGHTGSDRVLDRPPSLGEGQVLIEYPDAPLTGGHLRMRVLVGLDAEGHIETLEGNAGSDIAEAFFESVKKGLGASTFLPAYLNRHAVASKLCLEVDFDERRPGVETKLLGSALANREQCLGPGIAAAPPGR